MPVICFLRNACEEKYPAIVCKQSQCFDELSEEAMMFLNLQTKNVLFVYLTAVIKKVMIIYLTFA